MDAPSKTTETVPQPSRGRRIARTMLLAAVLGLAFLGYLSPDMRVQWESFMSMCGF